MKFKIKFSHYRKYRPALLVLCALVIVAVCISAPGLYRKWAANHYAKLLSQARRAAATDNLKQADKLYRKITKSRSASRLEWQEAGFVYQREGKLADASAAYEKALTYEKNNSSAWNSLGNLYRDQKQFDRARQAYEKAITISPNYSIAMVNAGNMLIVQQKNDEAIAFLSKYYDETRQRADVGLQLAVAYKQAGKQEEAKQTVKKVYLSFPENQRLQKIAEAYGVK